MDAADKKAERQRIEEEAASLVVGPLGCGDGAMTAAALRWAAQSPAHGVALAQAQAAWGAAERLRAVPPRDWRGGPAAGRAPVRPSRRMMIGGGLAAAASVTLAIGVGRLLGGRRLETAVGEQRSFALGDGSVVHLNTDTVIDLAVRDGRSIATMVRGEALFDLAAGASRPLTVVAGTAIVEAMRTAFDLSVRGSLAELLVERGMLTVLAQGHARKTISSGSSAAIEKDAVAIVSLPPAIVNQRLAWRRGVIDINGKTLAQATDEFNRYRSHPIIVADPAIASLTLGGTFATNESDMFVEAMTRSFPIVATRSDDGSILLSPVACSSNPAETQPCANGRHSDT